jgi:hypothetical protein
LLERDVENGYMASDVVGNDPLKELPGHSLTYRIAVRPQAGRKVFTLQTWPATPGKGGARLTDRFEGDTGPEFERFC